MKIDPNCIFCKIIKGEIPSQKIYEDDQFLAFLDIHPQSAGHAQLIPKEHIPWVWDVPNIGKYMETARKIALAQRKTFGTDMIVSRIIGDEVPHAHIWLFPLKHTKNESLKREEISKIIRENF